MREHTLKASISIYFGNHGNFILEEMTGTYVGMFWTGGKY